MMKVKVKQALYALSFPGRIFLICIAAFVGGLVAILTGTVETEEQEKPKKV